MVGVGTPGGGRTTRLPWSKGPIVDYNDEGGTGFGLSVRVFCIQGILMGLGGPSVNGCSRGDSRKGSPVPEYS